VPTTKFTMKFKNGTKKLKKKLEKLIEEHPSKRRLRGGKFNVNNIRQTAAALTETLEKGTILVREFYPTHIFNHMTKDEIQQFWGGLNLSQDDWMGLTKIHLATIFPGSGSDNFLRPIEEDLNFALKVNHVNMSGFLNMVVDADLRDDLEDATAERVLINSNYTSNHVIANINNTIDIQAITMNWDDDKKDDS